MTRQRRTGLFSISSGLFLVVVVMLSVGKAMIARFGARIRQTARHSRLTSMRALSTGTVDIGNIHKPSLIDQPVSCEPLGYTGVKYSTEHKTLPEETMYIFDGTAMLFASYYASGGATNGVYVANKNGSSYFKPAAIGDESVPVAGATLSADLNRRIVESMTDEQVRIMINAMNDAENRTSTTLKGKPSTEGAATPVTAEDRAKLQLRCEPLVAMLMQFARFIRDVQPKYLAVAFDAGRTTFRTKLYPQYKQHRLPTPAMLVPLFPLTVRVLEAVGAVCLAHVGYEADDIMASLGRWSRERGLNVVHCSQDKDMLQLVDTGIHVMYPRGRELVDADGVRARYGVRHPASMRDLQALMGDAVDNIPGVRGIGEKVAAAILSEFETVDALYEKLGLTGVAPVPESLAEALASSAELRAELEKALGKEGVEHAVSLLQPCFDGSKARALTALARLYQCGYQNVQLYKQLVTLREDLDIERIVLHSGSHAESLNRYRGRLLAQAQLQHGGDGVNGAPVSQSTRPTGIDGPGKPAATVASTDDADEVVSEAEEVIAATADLPMLSDVVTTEEVRGIVHAMRGVLLDEESSSSSVKASAERGVADRVGTGMMDAGAAAVAAAVQRTGEERLTTAYFRYTGERRPHAYALTHGTTTTSTGIDAGNPTTTSTRSAQEVERLLNEISPALKVPLQLLREQYHKLGNKD